MPLLPKAPYTESHHSKWWFLSCEYWGLECGLPGSLRSSGKNCHCLSGFQGWALGCVWCTPAVARWHVERLVPGVLMGTYCVPAPPLSSGHTLANKAHIFPALVELTCRIGSFLFLKSRQLLFKKKKKRCATEMTWLQFVYFLCHESTEGICFESCGCFLLLKRKNRHVAGSSIWGQPACAR